MFHDVRALWINEGLTGAELYRHAADAAAKAGWLLDPVVAGHRLSGYPHAAIHAGPLARFERRPTAMQWVVECHIRDPQGRFGASFEDMLLPDEYYA